METTDLKTLTVVQLKDLLRAQGLPVSGTKNVLVERLQAAPVQPTPVQPAPGQPAPVQPAPVQPLPGQPGRMFDFAGKSFAEPPEGFYYNLATGQRVKNIPVGSVALPNVRVVGPPDILETFRQQNRIVKVEPLQPTQVTTTTVQTPGVTHVPVPGVGLTRPEARALLPTLFTLPAALTGGMMPGFLRPVIQPAVAQQTAPQVAAIGQTYPQLEVQPVCRRNEAGTVLYLQTTDIEEVPRDHLERLCEFSLARLDTKAIVMAVLDGDTYDLAFFVNLATLAEPGYVRTRGGLQQVQPALTFVDSPGFVARMHARLYGVDAYEKDTPPGAVAKALVTQTLAEHKNVAYVTFREFDKYGRPLVDLYLRPDKTESIGQLLLDYVHPEYGHVAEVYFGDTKSDRAKQLVEEARQRRQG